ncbi:uncharacterized protein LOC129741789 [Uranotaenia lowii]|uniref:uncharacterized protein LOC129741789 n=1 Tax=Uranotaenia lowii TaxID=190385 RepID=UPI002479B17E|nr:uncharacterized protein LOC129741789 [Uranotaenia lowii]
MAASQSKWGDPPKKNKPLKTLPDWMDAHDEFGETQFLVVSASKNNQDEETTTDKSTTMPKNPFIFSKTIAQLGIKVDEAKPIENGNRYLLKVRNQQCVNKLLNLKKLIDGTEVLVEHHQTLNTSQCVVTCHGVAEMSEKELLEELASQNVVRIFRFVKKEGKKEIPSNTMVLTLKTTRPPTHVYFGAFRIATRPYYPKPLQCFGCGAFGHKKPQCKSQEICLNCGGKECVRNGCQNTPKCINCQGTHSTMDRNCPMFQEELEICKIKTDLKIPYFQAQREYKTRTAASSFAGISKIQRRLETPKEITEIEKKDKIIAQLEQKIQMLQKEIEMLGRTALLTRKKLGEAMEEDPTSEMTVSSEDETDINSLKLKLTPKRKIDKESSDDQSTPTYYYNKQSLRKERKLKKMTKKEQASGNMQPTSSRRSDI